MSRTYHGEIRVALMSSDMRSLKPLRECLRECCDACHLSSRSVVSLYSILGKISRVTRTPTMIVLNVPRDMKIQRKSTSVIPSISYVRSFYHQVVCIYNIVHTIRMSHRFSFLFFFRDLYSFDLACNVC